MGFYPLLEDWGLFFKATDGYANRSTITLCLAEFWNEPHSTEFVVPGKCVVIGRVYGKHDTEDGKRISTSYIEKIEKLVFTDEANDSRTLFSITTESGSHYFAYADECSKCMDDLLKIGELESKRWLSIRLQRLDSNLI